MTSPLSSLTLLLLPAIAAAALAATPAAAASEADGQAVAQCRAELLARFGEDGVRSHRVAEIAGNSRGTRVTIIANADRRYRFECRTGRDGEMIAATLDPPRGDSPRLAAGQR